MLTRLAPSPTPTFARAVAFVLAVVSTGCISKAKEVIAPTPDTVGTMTCREVVEQCDSQCSDPICINRCTAEGNEEAQGQHAALLDCGQRNGCTDQECMESNCPSEIATCMGPDASEQAPAAPAEEPPPAEAPDSQAPAEEPPPAEAPDSQAPGATPPPG